MTEQIKKHEISDIDRETIKKIATKAKELRKEKGYSYEEFAMHAQINRNTYFKFEKSATTGDNFTIVILNKVLRGLDESYSSFFTDI